VSAAVAAITQQQLDRLLQIARRRIERLTQSPAVQRMVGQRQPIDFVHDAIMLVLVGEEKPGLGRHTHRRHLDSSKAFLNFLQGIVHSLISAQLGKTIREGEHVSAEEQELMGTRTVTQDVQFNEVKAHLAARLRAAAGDNPIPLSRWQNRQSRQLHYCRKLNCAFCGWLSAVPAKPSVFTVEQLV
jgi:hypothetical protein